jgi:hypothetical protein
MHMCVFVRLCAQGWARRSTATVLWVHSGRSVAFDVAVGLCAGGGVSCVPCRPEIDRRDKRERERGIERPGLIGRANRIGPQHISTRKFALRVSVPVPS